MSAACSLVHCALSSSPQPGATCESHTFASHFRGDVESDPGSQRTRVCRAGLPGLERLSGVFARLLSLQGFRRYFTRISQQEKWSVSNRKGLSFLSESGEAARLDLPASQAPGFDEQVQQGAYLTPKSIFVSLCNVL